jgi:RNA polymerase sigma-70 factor (ECF subfamily)
MSRVEGSTTVRPAAPPRAAEDDQAGALPSAGAAEDPYAASRATANAAMDRYAAGDDGAFEALYDALAPRLRHYLLRQVKDGNRADDLLQQTMLQIHTARGRFLAGAEVVPWAFAIARRLTIDSYRRRKHDAVLDDGPAASSTSSGPAADDLLHAKRMAAQVERELARLPESQRVAFELVKQEGLSLREAAQVLGTTVTAIKLRAHRAYVALRAALGDAADLR